VPDRPLFTALVSEQVARQLAVVWTNALQILGFAAIGLVLALVGVHGALGASRDALRVMVLRDALLLVVAGLVIGLPLAAFAARFIGDLLHGTSLSNPSVYVGVTLVVLGASLVASWIPAHRASRVDPISALRN
jgi:ABC-type lipoprotein release transport system permease subunit